MPVWIRRLKTKFPINRNCRHIGGVDLQKRCARSFGLSPRSKGYATHLVTYLLTWGQAEGAGTAFLQVDAANVAAISIYRKFGFETAYQYWHRVAPKDAVKQK